MSRHTMVGVVIVVLAIGAFVGGLAWVLASNEAYHRERCARLISLATSTSDSLIVFTSGTCDGYTTRGGS